MEQIQSFIEREQSIEGGKRSNKFQFSLHPLQWWKISMILSVVVVKILLLEGMYMYDIVWFSFSFRVEKCNVALSSKVS